MPVASIHVALAQQIKDLLPTLQGLGSEMDEFFSTLSTSLDDAITQVNSKGTIATFTIKVKP